MDNAARGWRDPQVRRAATILLILTLGASPAAWAEKAYFAGGCFWCMESDFEGLPGVEDVVSGFTGGTAKSPTYNGDHTGHYEAVEITYDPSIASYQDLLDHYWVNIDPFDATGQFCDKGPSYRAAIFVSTPEESRLAEQSKQDVQAMFPDQRVVTKILDACGALSRCRGTCWCWLTRTGRPLPPSCACR